MVFWVVLYFACCEQYYFKHMEHFYFFVYWRVCLHGGRPEKVLDALELIFFVSLFELPIVDTF